jgi:hypothetical protein
MPSYSQLDGEAAWRAETAAPALVTLGQQLRRRWPAAQIGIRGNDVHLSGYHRSRRWIKESRFSKNRTYSVSRTAGDRSGGDPNWACALDFGGISQSELHAVCKRLDSAVRAGRLEKITEWYGNFGGDDRVDGFDNIADRLASSDSSHLTHLHMSFDRGRANEDHSDVLAVLIGDDMSWDETLPLPAAEFPELGGQTKEKAGLLLAWTAARGRRLEVQVAGMRKDVQAIVAGLSALQLSDDDLAKVAEQAAALIGGKLQALLDALPKPATAAEIAKAVADKDHPRPSQ